MQATFDQAKSLFKSSRTSPDPPLPTTSTGVPASNESSASTITTGRDRRRVSTFARRIHGWSWQAFPIGMGTSAVYLSLSGWTEPFKTKDLIEIIFYIMTVILFLLNILTFLLQAVLYPSYALQPFVDADKGAFVPLIVLNFASIIIGLINYGVPRGYCNENCVYSLFWVYVAFAVLTCFPLLFVWFNRPHNLAEFTPAYAFLFFPMMLVGVVAFNVLSIVNHHEPRAIRILLAGYIFQGLGFFMTFFFICIYILRTVVTGFPTGRQANGAFIVCGPPGFTALALIRLGQESQDILPLHGLMTSNAGDVWFAGSVMAGLMLFGLAFFFFVFSLLPWWLKVEKRLHNVLGFWALTFPNVGWIVTLRVLGTIFDLQVFTILHLIFATMIAVIWIILVILTISAFFKGFIFESGPEDVLKDSAFSFRHHGIVLVHTHAASPTVTRRGSRSSERMIGLNLVPNTGSLGFPDDRSR